MQFGNKNNDMEIIAQILASRRQPVSGGQVVLPSQNRGGSSTDLSGLFQGTGQLLGGLATGFGKDFDFEGMKDKYSKPYTTNDMANNTYGGFPSIDYGLPTKGYEKPSWLGGEEQLSQPNTGFGLQLKNNVPKFTGFGG